MRSFSQFWGLLANFEFFSSNFEVLQPILKSYKLNFDPNPIHSIFPTNPKQSRSQKKTSNDPRLSNHHDNQKNCFCISRYTVTRPIFNLHCIFKATSIKSFCILIYNSSLHWTRIGFLFDIFGGLETFFKDTFWNFLLKKHLTKSKIQSKRDPIRPN